MTRCVPPRARHFHRTLFAVILLAGLSSIFQVSLASDFLIRSWQTEDGLPQHSGTAIAQTRDGYLWVGTFNGLVRFNGAEFTRFTIANTPELKSDDINTLCVDGMGRLWIGTMTGLVSYEGGTFKRWNQDAKLNRTDVRSLARRSDGVVFVLSSSGVWRIEGDRAREIKLPEGVAPSTSGVVITNGNGQIWLTIVNRIYEVAGEELRLICQMPLPVSSFLVQDSEGAFWFRQEDDVAKWKPGESGANSNAVQQTPGIRSHGMGVPRAFLRTRYGDRWIGTQSGLFYWPEGAATPEKITGLPSDRILSLLEDRDGNIWAGTDGGGFSLITRKQLAVYGAESGLPGEDVISVIEDDLGRIWVGLFEKGLCVGKQGKWQPFLSDLIAPSEPINALCQARDGAIWVGRYSRPLLRIENGQAIPVPNSRLRSGFALFEDREGRIWAGSQSDGVECFEKGLKVTRWTTTNGLSDNSIGCFAQDRAGAIWIGTQNNGLNRLQNEKITQFHAPSGPPSDGIRTLYVDSNGTLWIGTVGAGLTRYKDGKFATLSTQQGLYSDVVNEILEDDGGDLWIGSATGIFTFSRDAAERVLDGKTGLIHCTVFNRKDGMRMVGTPGGFQPTNMKGRDGRLWFATGGGLVVIDPRKIRKGFSPPPVHIERLLVDGLEVTGTGKRSDAGKRRKAQKIPDDGGTITVSPGAKRLELHYVGINFADPQEVQYKYWLEGYEADWQEVGTRPMAFFSKVPPGQYVFHVKAAGQDSDWKEKDAELTIILLPYFWQTDWFRGIVFASAAGLLWLIYHLRIRSIRQVEQLRIRIARDLHDDVGSNIANIALLSQMGQKPVLHHWPGASEAPELKEIHEVALETADVLRDVTWFINPEFDTSSEMVQRLRAVAERMLKTRLTSFQVMEPITSRKLSIAIRRNVLLIFKEILHNILKHSGATEVRIECSAEPGWFRLVVADNGVGFDPVATSSGQGLESMRQRVRQVNGMLDITSSPRRGARIAIKIPLA